MTGSNVVCDILEFGDWPMTNAATIPEILLGNIKASFSALNPHEA